MEGFLPGPWWQFWTVLAAVCVLAGMISLVRLVRRKPESLPLLGLAGAFVFILSSLKIPSLGSSSHATGTGFGSILFGPAICSVFCSIVLVFQALLLAHGGITTLGANIISMGLAGPLAACIIFKIGHLIRSTFGIRSFSITVFCAAAAADLVTYMMTSLQLALAYPSAEGGVLATFLLYLGIFSITQIPLALLEGVIIVLMMRFVIGIRPDIFVSLGILSKKETNTLLPGHDPKHTPVSKHKWLIAGLIIVLLMAALAFSFAVFGPQPGSDDLVAETLIDLGNLPVFDPLNLVSEDMHGWLFALQAGIGAAGVILCLYLLRTRAVTRGSAKKPHTIFDEHILDDVAIASPLRHISAWLKLVFCLSAIVIGVISPLPYLPLFIAGVMICAALIVAKVSPRLYASLLSIPLVFAGTGALVILFITGGGETLVDFFRIGTFHVQITTESLDLAILVLSRTFAGMCSLYFLTLTTPMTSLFEVFRNLRMPQAFIDLSMLIYRYIFVFIGEAIAIHNAQIMRGGYGTWKNYLTSFSMLVSMLFIRTWEKGEAIFLSMDSRCYDGYMALPDEGGHVTPLSVTSVFFFIAFILGLLFTEMLLL
ncbi:energy-coupling factor ABC transporter permease [Methanocorpusculum sp.]|uniref:energy-coupling factor ABC transporter permease n=1 Tax=Methanocorpusculum sp. TaxID=2058474 RepID=UPI00351D424C